MSKSSTHGHLQVHLVQFEQEKNKVRAIAVNENTDSLSSIFFHGANNRKLCSYNPSGSYREQEFSVELKDTEMLIGVYGVKNKKHYFTSFGFLVIDHN